MEIFKITPNQKTYGMIAVQQFFDLDKNKQYGNDAFFEKPYNIMMVAVKDEQVIGMVYGYELERPDTKKKQLFIYSIDVLPEYRRQGVATKLLESFLEPLNEGVYQEAFVMTNQKNAPAMHLYQAVHGKIVTKEDDHDVLFVFEPKKEI